MLLPLRTIHLSGGKEGKAGVQKNPKQLFLDISFYVSCLLFFTHTCLHRPQEAG